MAPSHLLRALGSALALLSAALAPSCGGTFDSGTGPAGVSPGAPCSEEGRRDDSPDGCNTCTCDGRSYSCTERVCAADGGSGSCQPGATRPAGDGCNKCVCTDDGAWACTQEGCGECRDGATTRVDCNTCTCAGGSWACTKMACEPPPECSEGESTYDGCNTCTCAGGAWACTERACPPPQCSEGESTYDGCNTCKCEQGSWTCTGMYCEPAADAGVALVGCGGWLGDTCGSGEYCAYEEGQLCGAADASSVCRPRPQGCGTVYEPVCGCDGATYNSACVAALEGTGILSAGPCEGVSFR